MSYQVLVIWHFGSGEEVQKRFQDGCHLGLPIKMILAIFDLQVALILPTMFPVNWPFHSGEVKNRVSNWWPSWISALNDFSYS